MQPAPLFDLQARWMRSPSRYIASSSLIAEMRSLRSTNTRLDMFNPSASSRADIDAIRSYVSSRQLSEVSVKQLEMRSNFGYFLVTPLRASVAARRQSHVWAGGAHVRDGPSGRSPARAGHGRPSPVTHVTTRSYDRRCAVIEPLWNEHRAGHPAPSSIPGATP